MEQGVLRPNREVKVVQGESVCLSRKLLLVSHREMKAKFRIAHRSCVVR